MPRYKILFSNLGYATGINGSMAQHIGLGWRHLYSPRRVQTKVLQQFRALITQHRPDICCIVEIDQGSLHSARFNQIEALLGPDFEQFDISCKYDPGRWLGRLPFHSGKSNGFLSRTALAFRRRYLSSGSKRLCYEMTLPGGVTLFFTHFSLNSAVRQRQFTEIRQWMQDSPGAPLLLADFNIFRGESELAPLLEDGALRLLNQCGTPTFTFHRRRHMLDLAIGDARLAPLMKLDIIPQPFSDHAALLLTYDSAPE